MLRARTSLPIALKGILHADDARAAREHGIDAVVVSNHGGRQVDGAVASVDALPAIADAARGELGVLLGRPYLWGLAAGGERGVPVLRATLAELDLTIGLSGHARPAELGVGALIRGC